MTRYQLEDARRKLDRVWHYLCEQPGTDLARCSALAILDTADRQLRDALLAEVQAKGATYRGPKF